MKTRTILEDDLVEIKQSFYPAGFRMETHSHDFAAVSFILKGSFNESSDGGDSSFGSTQTLIKPRDLNHSNVYTDDCLILCMYLKDETVLSANSKQALSKWDGSYGFRWNHLHSYLRGHQSYREKKELLGSFLDHLNIAGKGEIPDWLFKLKAQIDDNYSSGVCVSELAAQYSVHPVYLARVFRKCFGLNLKAYLQNLRVRNAMASMILESKSLTQIGIENGFSDQSHFIRSFKSETGTTPLNYRRLIA